MLLLSAATPLWRTIDQPVALKGLVAMVGLVLIAWQFWWSLGRHGGGVAARESEAGLQEITIIVDGGYAPSRIKVKAGQPMRLAFQSGRSEQLRGPGDLPRFPQNPRSAP